MCFVLGGTKFLSGLGVASGLSVTIERRPQLAEQLYAHSPPVWEVVISIPAPRGDQGQRQKPAFADEFLIRVRIVLAHLFGHVSNIELDGPPATGLEVDEQRPVLGPEQIARVRLAVQELLDGAPLSNRSAQPS